MRSVAQFNGHVSGPFADVLADFESNLPDNGRFPSAGFADDLRSNEQDDAAYAAGMYGTAAMDPIERQQLDDEGALEAALADALRGLQRHYPASQFRRAVGRLTRDVLAA